MSSRYWNASETPPIQLDEHAEVGEDIRLKYRYIDLRRPEMAARLRFRSKVGNTIRNFLDNNGFLDIETPLAYESNSGRSSGLSCAKPHSSG